MPNEYNPYMIPWLDIDTPFPPVTQALREPNGLLAAGGELSAARLIDAYRRGIFPWFSEGEPVLWWSPDPRMVLAPAEFKISRSLGKRIRKHDYEIRVDSAFAAVMRACAEPRAGQRGTWISEAMIAAYRSLHAAGFAHSVETWIDGELAGGLYGVALGRMFYGESMFTRASDASKLALAALTAQIARWGFRLIDCQMNTAHLASLGAHEMHREDFLRELAVLVNCQPPPVWRFDADLT
jgi:leucyl/phenylalanyl-tRNA--protein transferase